MSGLIAAWARLSTLAASGGAALIGFLQAGAGAVARTMQAKVREQISVKDFGAVGNGVADDTAAIQAAFDAARAMAVADVHYGVTVFFPRGNYKITSTLTIPLYVNLVGETVEGVLIIAKFNGNAFEDEVTAGASYLYFTRIEELTVLKSDTNGANNTTGKCFYYRHNMQFCRFSRLRLYGGDYALHGENVGGNYWNCYRDIFCYYQQAANVYLGQGSNVVNFWGCGFNFAPIGVEVAGTSYAVNFHGCSFEGWTSYAIKNYYGQVFVSGGYFEQTGAYTMFYTVNTGSIDVVGAFLGFDAGGYLTDIPSTGRHRIRNCTLNNVPAGYYNGTYGLLYTEFSDNNAIGTTPAILQGYNMGGTFVPIVYGTVSGGAGTYTSQIGRWHRVGTRVHFQIEVAWTAHTGTGSIGISGLPFAANAAGNYPAVSVNSSNLTFVGQLGAAVQQNTSVVILYAIASGAGIAYQAMDAAATLYISGNYEV